MDVKDFNDYKVASISEEDVSSISKLERQLSDKAENDIVLIAYQPNKNTN